jgi:serine/threonine protein kinase
MAPETLRQEVQEYTTSADVYSFAIVLWELGKWVFLVDYPRAVLLAAATRKDPFDEYMKTESDVWAIRQGTDDPLMPEGGTFISLCASDIIERKLRPSLNFESPAGYDDLIQRYAWRATPS